MIGVVTGLRREARIAARAGLATLCLGPGPAAARQAAEALHDQGATMLASFGYAGGLDPELIVGNLMVADRIVSADGTAWPVEADTILAILPEARVGAIVGLDAPAATVAAKVVLAALGAAVDTESQAVAAVAARGGIPCIAVRAIVDGAERTLPDAALAATAADGGVRIGALIAALAAHPSETRSLAALARAVRQADRALARAAAALAQLPLSASRTGPRPR